MGRLDDVEIRHYTERVTASYVDGAGARYLVELARIYSRNTGMEERWVAGVQRDGQEVNSEDPIWAEIQEAFDRLHPEGGESFVVEVEADRLGTLDALTKTVLGSSHRSPEAALAASIFSQFQFQRILQKCRV